MSALAILVILTSQVTARITPLAFKGITQYFNQEREFYSPTLGITAIESGLIYNLRFYGNFTAAYKDGQPTTERDYINDYSEDPLWELLKTLFPSAGGDLTTSTAGKSNFGRHVVAPKTIALLLDYAHQIRMKGTYTFSNPNVINVPSKQESNELTPVVGEEELDKAFKKPLISLSTYKNYIKRGILTPNEEEKKIFNDLEKSYSEKYDRLIKINPNPTKKELGLLEGESKMILTRDQMRTHLIEQKRQKMGQKKKEENVTNLPDPLQLLQEAVFNSLRLTGTTEEVNLKKNIQWIIESIQQSINHEPNSFYPRFTTEQVILAFFCEAFDTQQDIFELLGALAELDTNSEIIQKEKRDDLIGIYQEIRKAKLAKARIAYDKEKKEAEDTMDVLEQGDPVRIEAEVKAVRPFDDVLTVDDRKFDSTFHAENLSKEELEKFASFSLPSNLLLAENDLLLIAEKSNPDIDDFYNLANADIFTSIIPYKPGTQPTSNSTTQAFDRTHNTSQQSITFQDCVETVIRHILNLITYNQINRKFDLKSLEEYTKNQEYLQKNLLNLDKFYKVQLPTLANAGNLQIRSLWNRVVGDLNANDKPIHIAYSGGQSYQYDMDPGFINVINVFRKIFGLDNKNIKPLDLKAATLEEKKEWIRAYFVALFNIINPNRRYTVDTKKLHEGNGKHQPDVFGDLQVTVMDKEKEFSFTINFSYGHGVLLDLRVPTSQSTVDYTKIFTAKNFGKIFTKAENTTIDSLRLLVPTMKDKLSEPLYEAYGELIQDNDARIRKLQYMYSHKEKAKELPFIRPMLIHLLDTLAWADEEVCRKATDVILSLQETFPEIVREHVKGLSFSFFSEMSDEKLSKILNNFINIEYFNLFHNNVIKKISLENLSKLKTLSLYSSGIQEIKGLEGCKSLETLILNNSSELNQNIILKDFNNLKVFDLVGARGIQKINLENCNSLLSLSLLGNNSLIEFSAKNMSKLKLISMTLFNVEKINLENCGSLEDFVLSGPRKFANISLKGLDNLKKFFINSSTIMKISGLESCTLLKELSLAGNKFQDNSLSIVGYDNLRDITFSKSNFQELYVKNCKLLNRLDLSYTKELKDLTLENVANLKNLDLVESSVQTVNGENLDDWIKENREKMKIEHGSRKPIKSAIDLSDFD